MWFISFLKMVLKEDDYSTTHLIFQDVDGKTRAGENGGLMGFSRRYEAVAEGGGIDQLEGIIYGCIDRSIDYEGMIAERRWGRSYKGGKQIKMILEADRHRSRMGESNSQAERWLNPCSFSIFPFVEPSSSADYGYYV